MQQKKPTKYTAFLSYSTDPDYWLVRKTESFLETFHRQIPPHGAEPLPPMKICVDGSDFHLKSDLENKHSASLEPIHEIIYDHLSQCTYLVVFCSKNAASSTYVNDEARWFYRERGPEKILLVVTEGSDQEIRDGTVFPPAILEADLHKQPWYDFRLARLKTKYFGGHEKFRDYEDARVQLACHLNGTTAGLVLPLWHREQERKKTQKICTWTAVCLLIVLLSAIVAITLRETRISFAKTELDRLGIVVDDTRSLLSHQFSFTLKRPTPSLAPANYSPHLSFLISSGDVNTIDFSFAQLDSLTGLEPLRTAKTLKFEYNKISSLTPLKNLKSVHTLGLADNPEISHTSFKDLTSIHELSVLDLSYCKKVTDEFFTDDILKWLKACGCKRLALNGCEGVTERSARKIASLPFQRLELRETGVAWTTELVKLVANSSSLEILSTSGYISDEDKNILEKNGVRLIEATVGGL